MSAQQLVLAKGKARATAIGLGRGPSAWVKRVLDADGKDPAADGVPRIRMRDMLQLLAQKGPDGKPTEHNIVCHSHNRKTGRGGRRIELTEAALLTEDALPNPRARAERRKAGRAPVVVPFTESRTKPGNHFRHATRNLILPDGTIHRTIIYTITEFDGMRVTL